MLPLRMRVRKGWSARRSKFMRDLAVGLGDLSDACLRAAGMGPKQKEKSAKPVIRTYIGWRSLLLQLGTHRAISAALDSSVLGNDMPREFRMPAGRRILVLAAHQDDETIGAGGTLLLCARAGCEFCVVYYTDGANSFAGLDTTQTSRLRRDEAQRVWRRIAGIDPIFWDYPNRSPDIAPESGARLSALIESFQPTAIFVPVFLEQWLEHRRMSEVLALADAVKPLPPSMEIWGYQITTRAPGNVVVDITSVWKRKFAVNRLWVSQNYHIDYAHLAQGRDMANSFYLKKKKKRRAAAHAETFLAFDAPTYVRLTRELLDLPVRAPLLSRTKSEQCPPPNFFIIGLQDSGAQRLAALLDSHPQIRCFPSGRDERERCEEADLFHELTRLGAGFEGLARCLRETRDGHFSGILPKTPPRNEEERAGIRDAFRARFNEYCQLQRLRYGKPLVGESAGGSVPHFELIDRLYPQARKVCVLRDPRSRLVCHGGETRRRAIAAGEPNAAGYVSGYLERVEREYAYLLQASREVHVLTYEDLDADPWGTLGALLPFLGLETSRATIDAMIEACDPERWPRHCGENAQAYPSGSPLAGDRESPLPSAVARRIAGSLDGLTRRLENRYGVDLSSYRCESDATLSGLVFAAVARSAGTSEAPRP